MPDSARRAFGGALVWLALPAAAALALALATPSLLDRANAREVRALGASYAIALAWLTLRRAARRPLMALAGAAALLLLLVAPREAGGAPLASLLLGLALGALVLHLATREPGTRTSELAPLALAVAAWAEGYRLALVPVDSLATLVLLLLYPLAAAFVLARLLAAGRNALAGAGAALLALAPTLASEPWWILPPVAALAITGALEERGNAGRFARRALAALAALSLLLAAYPWLRRAPLAALADATAGLLAHPRNERLLGERALVLSAARPRLAIDLEGSTLETLSVESYLTNSRALPCDRTLATVTLDGEAGSVRTRLAIGRDSGEWAALRPDVAASLACPAPAPYRVWFPAEGLYLGETYRTRLALPGAGAPRRLVVERDPALPPEVELALFSVEARW